MPPQTTAVCVVSGGSAGIGLACVEKFIAAGFRTYNLDIQAGPAGEFIPCDMQDVAQIQAALAKIEQDSGRLDCLVCNAGIHYSASIEDTSEAMLDKVLDINVKGAFRLIRHSLPLMKAQGEGRIILLSSDQALVGKRNSFAYNLSKAALASMARTTALDYARYGIRVNAVCPGTVETPLYHQAIEQYCLRSGADKAQVHAEEAAAQPIGRLGRPQEVAELVYFLGSGKADFITGSLQVIDGGFTAQ